MTGDRMWYLQKFAKNKIKYVKWRESNQETYYNSKEALDYLNGLNI